MSKPSVKNLHKKTAQEVFDFVTNHLIEQGQRSGSAICLYRNGAFSCAAGCLIPDDLYSKKLEGLDWNSVSKILNMTVHRDLISALQEIHDNAEACVWVKHFKKLAKRLKLKFTVVDCG